MYPVIVEIGPITIYSFGLMMALAFLAAAHLTGRELERKGYDAEIASSLVLWAAVGGIAGARIWLVVDDWQGFIADPLGSLFSGAGFVFYGGFLGGALAVGWAAKHYYGLRFLLVADCVAPGLALAHGIGRIGCQLAGDGDWGSVTNLPWGMAYGNAIIGWDYPAGVRVHPTPIYEMVAYFTIAGALWHWRTRDQADGTIFAWYLILASIARFLVEFVRINPRLWLDLSAAQWTSIALVLVGVGVLFATKAMAGEAAAATARNRS
jgi:phosphatidylglycerol:prolipoprotein diacylglycerol transferase